MSFTLSHYLCPVCLGPLTLEESKRTMVCNSGHYFKIKDNIPVFSKNKGYYYGEISEEEMSELLNSIKENSDWEKGLSQFLMQQSPVKRDSLMKYICDNRRVAFKFLLPLKENIKVLDLGCGWGTISLNISNQVSEVHALDLTLPRLSFLKQWANSIGLKNLFVACAGDLQHLPYPDDFFDIVIMNGVLEWVPLSFEGDPMQVQFNYLQEIRRILKDDGNLYLAIENRYNYRYFLGKPDDHSGLLFGSILPRRIADLYSRIKKGKPYRTYTYSYYQYLSLLRSSGFPNVNVFIAYPIYRYPRFLINVKRVKSFHGLEERQLPGTFTAKTKTIGKRLIRFPHFAPSFAFIAGQRKNRGVIERVLLKEFPERQFEIDKCTVTKTQVLVIKCVTINMDKLAHSINKIVILKLPLSISAETHLMNHYKNITYFYENYPRIATLIPNPLRVGSEEKVHYFIEEYIEGYPGSIISNSDRRFEGIIWKSLKFIQVLHKTTARVDVNDELISMIRHKYRVIISIRWDNSVRNILNWAENYLENELIRNSIPCVFSHNDFHLGNIIFDKRFAMVRSVIDWNFAEKIGLPGLDVLHLVVRAYKVTPSDNLDKSIDDIILSGHPVFKEVFASYCNKVGVGIDLEVLVIAYILMIIWRNVKAIKDFGVGDLYYSRVHQENAELIGLLNILRERI
ncbi:methyltransferase domain-containing protein [candidate division WOR-3 bacterium]|nr:methyltransferase domain-containing protein [candidate division WOR-3 bacterium]MCK4527410.1 methyltransferase domain-containing protein [candidate division WOR-3 bacterium]